LLAYLRVFDSAFDDVRRAASGWCQGSSGETLLFIERVANRSIELHEKLSYDRN
jgi:hypothetical protein